MIRTEGEYREARRRLEAERARLQEYARQFKEMNLDSEQQKRALDPLQVFHEQLVDEIDEYERYKRGEFGELENLEGLGRWLVGARIASGLSQRAFANKLSIHESQVSRDERNEYHGVTVERAARLLQALGVVVRSTLDRVDTQQLRSVTAAHRRARVQVRETRLTTQAASFRPSPNDLIHEEVE